MRGGVSGGREPPRAPGGPVEEEEDERRQRGDPGAVPAARRGLGERLPRPGDRAGPGEGLSLSGLNTRSQAGPGDRVPPR